MFIELGTGMININQVQILTKTRIYLVGRDRHMEISEEDYEKLYLALAPRGRKAKDNTPRSDLHDLFDELHLLSGGSKKAVFTKTREDKLNRLLTKERMTPDMLRTAARNIKNNDYLQGQNDKGERYGDIDYLLRPDKAAKWSNEPVAVKRDLYA